MSLFTIAIIVYVVSMIILEIIQSGRKRKIPPTEGPFSPLKEIKEKKMPPPREEEIPSKEMGEGITLEYTEEKLEESKEGISLEYKEEKIEEKISKVGKKKEGEGILSLNTKNEILKLIIFKEIITPHPLTKRFLFKRRI